MIHDDNRHPRRHGRGPDTDEADDTPDTVVPGGESIQAAVDRASEGEVIGIEPGVFEEQVVVDTGITLRGAGPGATTIRSPPSIRARFPRGGTDVYPVVSLESDGAAVHNLTVDGARAGCSDEDFTGVGSYNASVSVSSVEVKRTGGIPPGGARHGYGILAQNDDGTERTIEIENCDIHDYQKAGVVGDGSGLDFHVKKSVVTGSGPTEAVRQNGIQVSSASRATIVGSTVVDNYSTPSNVAAGVAIYGSSDVLVAWNVIGNNNNGVVVHGTDDVLVRRNNIASNGTGVLNQGPKPLDARNNWWGAGDGPSARSDHDNGDTDPVTGAAATGSGDAVYNANWDPYESDRFDLGTAGTDRKTGIDTGDQATGRVENR